MLSLTWRPHVENFARQWYAVYTAPNHEKKVISQLSVRGIESFVPLYRAVRRWKNGCRMELELPLFPNYVFVRIQLTDRVRVLEVPSVLSLVGTGSTPTPLNDHEVGLLREGLPLRKAQPHPYLNTGSRARIRRGALAGMEGTIVSSKNNYLRVVLSLDLIMRSVVVEVPLEDLELLGPVAGAGSELPLHGMARAILPEDTSRLRRQP
jgi:transcription antitermination factor NusG